MGSRSDQYASNDQRADDPYSEQEEYDAYGDEGRHDEDDRRFSYLPTWSWGWWPSLGPRNVDDQAEDPYGETEVDEGDGVASLWDEGLITLLIVGGAILFVIPEPATSALGVLLVTLGVIAWLVDWAL